MHHLYRLMINTPARKAFDFTYFFGGRTGVQIGLSARGVFVEVRLQKDLTLDKIRAGNAYLFSDAIPKAYLLYLIKFGRPLVGTLISLQKDDQYTKLKLSKNDPPLLYSMIERPLVRQMNGAFLSRACSATILRQTGSGYDARMAALFALLCAKSRSFESERFTYLWMAMNGLYSYYATLLFACKGKKIQRECEQLKHFSAFLEHPITEFVPNSDKKRVAEVPLHILAKMPEALVRDQMHRKDGDLFRRVGALLYNAEKRAYGMDAYAYLLICLPYYVRCNLFHANRPTKLFSSMNDGNLQSLQTINGYLEDFLDEELYKWFDEAYIEHWVKPPIQEPTNAV